MDERIKKLPKWAQEKIRHLEERVEADRAYYIQKVRQLGGHDETNTYIRSYSFDDDIPLPNSCDVLYTLKNGNISARVEDGKLKIHTYNCFYYDLLVQPLYSNSIQIRVGGRDRD